MTVASPSPGPGKQRALDLALLVAGLLVAWQAAYALAGSMALSSPLATARYAYGLILSDDFWPNVWSTMRAFAVSIVIETIAGLGLGVLLGLRRVAGDVVEPILAGLYSVPKIIFYPIILLFFGIGLAAEVAFGVLHGIVPIIMFTMNAVRNIKPVYLKAARVLNLTFGQTLWTVALPGALPEIFTGLRIGFSGALIGIILSEMFGSRQGLGFMLVNAIGNNQTTLIMALTLILVVFAAALSGMLLLVDEKLHHRA